MKTLKMKIMFNKKKKKKMLKIKKMNKRLI